MSTFPSDCNATEETPVRSSARIKTAVQTPIGIEPGNAVAVRAIDPGEMAADEHLAIRLHGYRTATCGDKVIIGYARIDEIGVRTPVGIKPGNSIAITHKHFAVRLQHDRNNSTRYRARIESGVAAAIGIEPGEPRTDEAFDRVEVPANEHLAVGLHNDGVHRAIGAKAGIKGQVKVPRGAARVKTERAQLQQETARENDGSDRVSFFHSMMIFQPVMRIGRSKPLKLFLRVRS